MYLVISWPLRKRKNKHAGVKETPCTFWQGNWHVTPLSPPQGHRMILSLSSEGTVLLNHQQLKGEMTYIGTDKWIFRDHFGYRLILEKTDDGAVTLYDEVDDKLYTAEKID